MKKITTLDSKSEMNQFKKFVISNGMYQNNYDTLTMFYNLENKQLQSNCLCLTIGEIITAAYNGSAIIHRLKGDYQIKMSYVNFNKDEIESIEVIKLCSYDKNNGSDPSLNLKTYGETQSELNLYDPTKGEMFPWKNCI